MAEFETSAEIIERLQRELDEHGEGAVVNNRSRVVVHDENEIYILHWKSGQVEVVSYDPELYYVLCHPSMCSYQFDYKKMRIAVGVQAKQKDGKPWTEMLGRFIYLWKKNDRPTDEFMHDLPRDKELSVDHVNGDPKNHMFWNLSGITRKENQKKYDLPLRIKPPYYCHTTIDEQGKYRVAFGYDNAWHQGQEMLFICDGVDRLVDLYRAIMNISRTPAFLHRGETPLALWKADKRRLTQVENWEIAKKYTEFLLWLDESEFARWEIGNTIK